MLRKLAQLLSVNIQKGNSKLRDESAGPVKRQRTYIGNCGQLPTDAVRILDWSLRWTLTIVVDREVSSKQVRPVAGHIQIESKSRPARRKRLSLNKNIYNASRSRQPKTLQK